MDSKNGTAEPLTVTFEITPETIIGKRMVYGPDGDYVGEEVETIATRAAEIVGRAVYEANRGAWYSHDKVNEAIDKLIAERVALVFNERKTPTDSFGNPKGAETTLAELIDQRLTTWLRMETGEYGRRQSNLQKLVDAAVGHALTKEVNEAIAAAKLEAVATVRKSAAEVFAETIARAAGVR